MGGVPNAFLVGVGIHAECHRLVAVAQGLRDAGNVGPVGDGDTGKGVTEFVGMEIGHAAPLRQLFEIPGRALRVHRLRVALLREHKGANTLPGLFLPELAQQGKRQVTGVHGPGVAVLRRVQIDALRFGVTQIPGYGDCSGLEVDILPAKGTALPAPNARVDQHMNQRPPFQRLQLQRVGYPLDLCHRERPRLRGFGLSLPGFGPLHLVHWVTVDHVR